MDRAPKQPSQSPGTSPVSPDVRFNFCCKMCGSVLEALASLSGTPGRCPTCAAVFNIPHVDHRTGLAMGTADGGAELQDPTPVHAYAAAGEKAPAIVQLDDGSRTILCPRCHATSGIENNSCATCGFPFTIEGADRAAQAATDAFAVTSFIVGLISLPLCMCASAVGGLGALVAAVLGWSSLNRITATGRTRGGRGLAIAGLVFAIIGLAIALARIAGLL